MRFKHVLSIALLLVLVTACGANDDNVRADSDSKLKTSNMRGFGSASVPRSLGIAPNSNYIGI